MSNDISRLPAATPRPQSHFPLHAATDTNVEDYDRACRHRAQLQQRSAPVMPAGDDAFRPAERS